MAEVTYTRDGRIARIHIDAAARGNAFTPQMRREVNEALTHYRDDDEAWMAVISGEGKDFCAGSADSPGTSYAALQGQCKGEGLALALSCDLRVADDTTALSADFSGDAGEPNVLPAWLVAL